jgi:uncharacterized protein
VDRPGSGWFSSRYNFAVSHGTGDDCRAALYNSGTGALTQFEGRDALALAAAMTAPATSFEDLQFDETTLSDLRRGGFLVRSPESEVAVIRKRFRHARGETPAVLTITTTMDCNLGCYYCYEERSQSALEAGSIDDIIALLDRTLIGRRTLHVDWYGGEPLLNFAFIELASAAIQNYCGTHGISYHASIISNGTMWPDDPVDFVTRHRIRQVQISFDGMRANHDKRRRTRKGFRYTGNRILLSSFDCAVDLVDRLVTVTRVDIRFNIDRGNRADLIPFVEFAEARGWFTAAFPAVFQPARLAAYTESSAFMRAAELPLEEFDAARAEVRARLAGVGEIEESEIPDGYPFPKTSVCAALAGASTVIGADGLLYRCGLQVGEKDKAVGSLGDRNAVAGTDADWWSSFDPVDLPTCGTCSFLPVCWGGCPKKHLDRDVHAIAEQGRYWRNNLPRMIAVAAGFAEGWAPAAFGEDDQFRGDAIAQCGAPTS